MRLTVRRRRDGFGGGFGEGAWCEVLCAMVSSILAVSLVEVRVD